MLYVAFPFFEHGYLPGIRIEAGHGKARLDKLDDEGQAYIAEADDADAGGTGFDVMKQVLRVS